MLLHLSLITLHGVRRKSLNLGRCSHSEKQSQADKVLKAGMAKYEGIKEVVNQVAIQAAIRVMIAFRGMDAGPNLVPVSNAREPKWQKHGS